MYIKQKIFIISFFFSCACPFWAQEKIDTTRVYDIGEVIIKENTKVKELRSTTPTQILDGQKLKETGALFVSDGAKLLSGVVVKDYGGIGGLKTISVRSLGAAHTIISYDGIPITDTQTGQIDLGKLSLDNVSYMSLSNGQSDNIFQTARLFSAAGVLNISSLPPSFTPNKNINTSLSVKGGSFGFINPNFRIENKWNSVFSSNLLLDYVHIDGAYPYILENGEIEEKRKRENSDVESLKAEANLYAAINNQQKANLKLYYYQSERGLPTNILYNTYAGQRLWDKNFFAQSHYENKINSYWAVQGNAKFNWTYSRYIDPSTFITPNGTDDHYYQNEYYLSAAIQYRPSSYLSFSLANDGSINHMWMNSSDFPSPTRYTLLNVIAAKYINERFTATGHVLSTFTHETVQLRKAADNRHRFSPSISFSYQLFDDKDLRIRLLYKDIFRLPSFNDLYYGTVGRRNLKPEKAKEFNAGVTWIDSFDKIVNHFSLSADAFYNRVSDKIVADPTKDMFIFSMLNVGRVDIKGTEVNLETGFSFHPALQFLIAGNYTWQRALDKTDKINQPDKATYNHQIPYTPRHSGTIRFNIETSWINMNYTLLLSGERFSNKYNSHEYRLAGFHEHSISAYRTFKLKYCSLYIQGEILNLTDLQYDVVKNFPMPGRQFRGSITIKY